MILGVLVEEDLRGRPIRKTIIINLERSLERPYRGSREAIDILRENSRDL
jgi:hypothetical protein